VRAGDQFGSYLLEEKLAVGGMAEIFRARRLGVAGFARQVCIKRILPAFCGEAAFVEMFIDEARTGAQLRHGNIVAIDDFGEVGGQYFLCMELVSGADVARLLARLAQDGKACPVDVAAFIAAEVLRALDYAHRKKGDDGAPLGIVHRDVSPQNVLLSFAGEVKLTDFGIAKAASRIHHTMGQVVKGKIAYMAPEQARGAKLDGRADLFALGVVLFEVLAGRRPFQGVSETELVLALVRGQRPRVRELRPDVPPALEAILDGLLETDPARRIATAGEALDRIARAVPIGPASRTLASILAHYFPGHVSSLRFAEGFSRDSLPDAPASIVAGQEAARVALGLRSTEPATPTPNVPAPDGATVIDPPSLEASTPLDTPALLGDVTVATGRPVFDAPAPEPTAIAPLSVREPTPSAPEPAATAAASAQASTRTMMAPLETEAPPASPTTPPSARTRDSKASPARPQPTRVATVAALLLLLATLASWLALRPEDDPSSSTRPAAPKPGAPATPVESVAPAPPKPAPPAAPEAPAAPPSTPLAPSVGPPPAPGVDETAPVSAPAVGPSTTRGTLIVRVVPWANVMIDGRPRGSTPLHLTLESGVHTVRLTWPPGNMTRTRQVTVPAGGQAVVQENFRR
jgi:serine/threonine-protein kinase